ncbi:MAG TPA: hydrogenase maturation nickel metallochaperone HypA [Terriglobales bacterium]|nr:hydrogenase maturation nickel metallochaperone HypA [Terriglobales bacterium]
MHELSLAMSLIDGVEEECAARPGLKVRAVHLRLGALSGVNADALTFSYQLACQGTPLEGTALVTEATPGRELEIIGLEAAEL